MESKEISDVVQQKEGGNVLVELARAGSKIIGKGILKATPGYGDWLICKEVDEANYLYPSKKISC